MAHMSLSCLLAIICKDRQGATKDKVLKPTHRASLEVLNYDRQAVPLVSPTASLLPKVHEEIVHYST